MFYLITIVNSVLVGEQESSLFGTALVSNLMIGIILKILRFLL